MLRNLSRAWLRPSENDGKINKDSGQEDPLAYATCLTARSHPSDVEGTLVSGGLNISETLDAYIPLLSNPSFTGVPWVPLFQECFELRCFQLLSSAAWLLSNARPDN